MAELNPDLNVAEELMDTSNIKVRQRISKQIEEGMLKIIENNDLTLLLDQKKEKKEEALIKIWNLLNKSLEFAIPSIAENPSVLNDIQEIYFYAINAVNRKLKNPLVKINNNLFRFYLLCVFKNKGQEALYETLTGWQVSKVSKEMVTDDMKWICISIMHINEAN